MVVRELKDGRFIVATQEDHAELSAQFAAHWGNERFSTLRPYSTMMFATAHHDSGYREWEGNPPMNVEKGRPYAFREDVPSFEVVELAAYRKNIDWVRSRDPYAGLLVSMHRTGLWQNRYDVLTSPKGRIRERSAEVQSAKRDLELQQKEQQNSLSREAAGFENELWYNYRALQIYDLLSLYFCCDGNTGENEFKEYTIAPIRVTYESNEEVELRITPNGSGSVKMEPYPFDLDPLQVAVRARVVSPAEEKSEEACIERYHKAPRKLLTFRLTA